MESGLRGAASGSRSGTAARRNSSGGTICKLGLALRIDRPMQSTTSSRIKAWPSSENLSRKMIERASSGSMLVGFARASSTLELVHPTSSNCMAINPAASDRNFPCVLKEVLRQRTTENPLMFCCPHRPVSRPCSMMIRPAVSFVGNRLMAISLVQGKRRQVIVMWWLSLEIQRYSDFRWNPTVEK